MLNMFTKILDLLDFIEIIFFYFSKDVRYVYKDLLDFIEIIFFYFLKDVRHVYKDIGSFRFYRNKFFFYFFQKMLNMFTKMF